MTSHLLRSTERSELLNSFDVAVDSLSLSERKDQEKSHSGASVNFMYKVDPTSAVVLGSAIHWMIPSYDYLAGLDVSYKLTDTTGLSNMSSDGTTNDLVNKPAVFKMATNFGTSWWSSIVLQTASGRELLTLYPETTLFAYKNHEKNAVDRVNEAIYATQTYEDIQTIIAVPATTSNDWIGVGTSGNVPSITRFEAIMPLPFSIFQEVQRYYDSNYYEQLKLTINTNPANKYAVKQDNSVVATNPSVALQLRCHYIRRPVEVVEKIRLKSFPNDLTNMLALDHFKEVVISEATGGAKTLQLKCKNLILKTYIFVRSQATITAGLPMNFLKVSQIDFLDGASILDTWTHRELQLYRNDVLDTSIYMYVLDWTRMKSVSSASLDLAGLNLGEMGNPQLKISPKDTTTTMNITVIHEYAKSLTFDKNTRKVSAPAVM